MKKKQTKKKAKLFQTLVAVFVLILIVLLIKQLREVQQTNISDLGKETRVVEETEKIEISGVMVANFLRPTTSPPNGTEDLPISITISQTSNYLIFYLPAEELFIISITSYPFDEHRPVAENTLLRALAITKDEACKLNVDITTPAFVNPDKAGEVYSLSFCNDK